MSGATVSRLTAPGSAAIAVVEVRGPQAYLLAKRLFTPAGKSLPESPEVGRFWFGTLGRDEVVLSVTDADAIEVHCHGGPRVVRWVIEQFTSNGAKEAATRTLRPSAEGFELLQRAPTLRTASILLDQLNGAFAAEVRCILALLESAPALAAQPLRRLAQLGNTVGRHLVEPWKVVIAGPPNVGKSSLVNALAGYQRSVVSEVAGTTRDAVGVQIAFDGWPVELTDTAGIHAAEGLEAEGIKRAKRAMAESDVIVWVLDATRGRPVWPTGQDGLPDRWHIYAVNKCDLGFTWGLEHADAAEPTLVSAVTGDGIPHLAATISRQLVQHELRDGEAIPFTPRLIELVNSASAWPAEAAHLLREALAAAE